MVIGGRSSSSITHIVLLPPSLAPQIIATDGLWEFVSDQEAVDIAALKKDPQQAVDALIKEANRRWMVEEQVCIHAGLLASIESFSLLIASSPVCSAFVLL